MTRSLAIISTKYLEQFVYGAIDGTVTTFAVVAGATGAGFSTTVILILGFANLIADGFSMGVSAYLSKRSEYHQRLLGKLKERVLDQNNSRQHSLAVGFSTFSAFALAGFMPLIAYVVDLAIGVDDVFVWSSLLTAGTFGAIGYLKGCLTAQNTLHSIFETLLLGGAAALLAYYLGFFLEQVIT